MKNVTILIPDPSARCTDGRDSIADGFAELDNASPTLTHRTQESGLAITGAVLRYTAAGGRFVFEVAGKNLQ
tara:strand:+ start:16326 stop:16541 length:216 start_codon:yes stop_codon:yes gene_type:complete